jgi:hypothetical protein
MKRTASAALRQLSGESQRLFRTLCQEYGIVDTGGIEVLLSGLTSLDLAREAESRIRQDGPVLPDRWGQLKVHPLHAAARDHRAAWQQALRNLNLPIGDPPKPGRPGGL